MKRLWGIWADTKGSIALIGAMALSGVLGMSAMAVEGTAGYMTKVSNQRAADMAALAAALAYKANPSDAILSPTAQQVAAANGMTSNVVALKTTDPSGGAAIKVVVSTDVPLNLARAITTRLSYTVSSNAMASLNATITPACIVALSGGVDYGVRTTGGTRLDAGGCAISTNSGVSATSGTAISAGEILAGKDVWDEPTTWNGAPAITTNPGDRIRRNRSNAAVDTYGSDARLAAAFNRLGTTLTPAAQPLAPIAPVGPTASTGPSAVVNPTTPSGTNWDFNWNPTPQIAAYREKPNDNSSYVVPAGNYAIGTLTVQGGIKVRFVGSASSTVTINGGLNNTNGGTLNFGPGNYRINGGFQATATTTFGNGSYHIGNTGTINIGGTLTFGNGDLLWVPPFNPGWGTISFGTGAHRFNSFAPGVAVAIGAGAFSVAGNAVVSNFTFPEGDNQIGKDADGNSLTANGTVTFGTGNIDLAGALIVNGTMTKGAGYLRTGKNTSGVGISVVSNATLNFNSGAIDTPGSMTIAGTLNKGGGAIHVGGNLSVPGSMTTGAGDMDVIGSLTVAGTLTKSSGYLHTGVGFIVSGTLSAGAGDIDTAGVLTVSNSMTKTSGHLRTGRDGNNVGLNVSGTLSAGAGDIDTPGSVSIGGAITATSGSFITGGSVTLGGSKRLELGAGNFTVNGRITTAGGAVLRTGAGTQIVTGSGGVALDIAGGTVTFGDGPFSANGSISTSSGGVVTFGAAASHYINGNLSLTASATLGAGAYYIAGNLTNPTGGTIGGTGVTLILRGYLGLAGGAYMQMTAPTSDAGGGITDILIATKSATNTLIDQGARNVLTGLFYAPNSQMTLNGGATFSAPSGKCLMMVVSTLTLNGGTSSGSACSSLAGAAGSGSTGTVALVQ